MTDHNKDDGLNNQTPERNRANQKAASRPPVDAEHGLDGRGHMTANPRDGSAFEPMRTGSDGGQADRSGTSADDSAYVQNTEGGSGGPRGRPDVGEGTARGTFAGRDIGETDPAAGEGSTFQPLAEDPHAGVDFDDSAHRRSGSDEPRDDADRAARNQAAREGRPEGDPRDGSGAERDRT